MQSEWQPMSTAPKNGTPIIVSVGPPGVWNTVGEAYWGNGYTILDGPTIPAGWRWSNNGWRGGSINREPDCWMPLPIPPSSLPESGPQVTEQEEA